MGRIRLEELSDSLKEYLNGLGLTEAQVQELVELWIDEKIGDLNDLLTNNKSNLVSALNELFQSGNNAKQELVAALVAKGLSATTNMSFNDLISLINNLVKNNGTAAASDVLSGKTFINSTGNTITGSMVNQGSKTFTPSASKQTGAAGYYSKITVNTDSNLKAENIVSGVTIFGVTGKGYLA